MDSRTCGTSITPMPNWTRREAQDSQHGAHKWSQTRCAGGAVAGRGTVQASPSRQPCARCARCAGFAWRGAGASDSRRYRSGVAEGPRGRPGMWGRGSGAGGVGRTVGRARRHQRRRSRPCPASGQRQQAERHGVVKQMSSAPGQQGKGVAEGPRVRPGSWREAGPSGAGGVRGRRPHRRPRRRRRAFDRTGGLGNGGVGATPEGTRKRTESGSDCIGPGSGRPGKVCAQWWLGGRGKRGKGTGSGLTVAGPHRSLRASTLNA